MELTPRLIEVRVPDRPEGIVLVLHGGRDILVPEAALQAPFAAASLRGEVREFSDGEHTLYNRSLERDALVADWFADNLLR